MAEKDSVWKDAIEAYFGEFLDFFFPQIARDIDLEKGYEFLDKELRRIVKDADIGKRYADVLVKVYLHDGKEEWLLIHIEVQGYFEEGFEERMFVYNYRIFDRYKKEVISLAILADPSPGFRPHRYELTMWGFRHFFEFPVVKLIDYREKWKDLEESRNPFAVVVMAHLKEMETKKDTDSRLFWKITLVKRLYEKGYGKQDILLLYNFIDWLICLPDAENINFHDEITKYEEVKKMPYISTAEKIGIEKGMQQGIEKGIQQGIKEGEIKKAQEAIVEVLETRFETVPIKLIHKIKEIKEEAPLSSLHRKSVLVKDLEEFEDVMKKILK